LKVPQQGAWSTSLDNLVGWQKSATLPEKLGGTQSQLLGIPAGERISACCRLHQRWIASSNFLLRDII